MSDGAAGDDMLVGGAGADVLTGGGGSDLFVFDTLNTSYTYSDTIRDFGNGADHIGLSRDAFGAFAADAPGALDAAEFVVGTSALTADQHLIYDGGSGGLYYDPDGAGGMAQIRIATLTGHPAVSAADFILL